MGKPISRIPDSYVFAKWRNTTPVDDAFGRIGIGFDLEGGAVLRLNLSTECARHLSESLADYLKAAEQRVHSPRSSGMPNHVEEANRELVDRLNRAGLI